MIWDAVEALVAENAALRKSVAKWRDEAHAYEAWRPVEKVLREQLEAAEAVIEKARQLAQVQANVVALWRDQDYEDGTNDAGSLLLDALAEYRVVTSSPAWYKG